MCVRERKENECGWAIYYLVRKRGRERERQSEPARKAKLQNSCFVLKACFTTRVKFVQSTFVVYLTAAVV